MSGMYAHRVCICGREFTTDCNEYTCSEKCEDCAWELEMERRCEDEALDACRPELVERESGARPCP